MPRRSARVIWEKRRKTCSSVWSERHCGENTTSRAAQKRTLEFAAFFPKRRRFIRGRTEHVRRNQRKVLPCGSIVQAGLEPRSLSRAVSASPPLGKRFASYSKRPRRRDDKGRSPLHLIFVYYIGSRCFAFILNTAAGWIDISDRHYSSFVHTRLFGLPHADRR